MDWMMKSVLVAGIAGVLFGCGGEKTPGGKSLGENERKYADACIAGQGAAYRKLCECTARIVAPKLTAAELTSMEKMTVTQVWTEEKANAAGFSLKDTASFGVKKQESFAEMSRTCGGQI